MSDRAAAIRRAGELFAEGLAELLEGVIPATSAAAPPEVRLLTLSEVCIRLACEESFVRSLIRSGELPGVPLSTRAIRVREADVTTYVNRKSRPRTARAKGAAA